MFKIIAVLLIKRPI